MLFPCTDWVLGFTRLVHGDTLTGAALIPLNMVTQLLLYPVFLSLFTQRSISAVLSEIGPNLMQWCIIPAFAALALRLVMTKLLGNSLRKRILSCVDAAIPVLLAFLILALFSANSGTILEHPLLFFRALGIVFVFFVTVYWVGKAVARWVDLDYPARALLTMTTSARNAPMMLAVTSVAVADDPLVLAAIVLGMLIEFPHLTVVSNLLLHSKQDKFTPPSSQRDVVGI